MKLRKLLCKLLAAALLLTSCFCPAPLAAAEAEEIPQTEPYNTEAQISLLMSLVDTWQQDEPFYGTYYYAVTDLDQNGRLEIISAITQGSGIFTYGAMHEINESLDGLDVCWEDKYGEDDFPELTVDSVPAAYDAESGCYDYLFTNVTRNGAAESYEAIQPIRLQNGTLTSTTLASDYAKWIDAEQAEHEYSILSGDALISCTASEYESAVTDYQAERLGFTANFEWFTFESEVNESVLTSSLKVFQTSFDAPE